MAAVDDVKRRIEKYRYKVLPRYPSQRVKYSQRWKAGHVLVGQKLATKGNKIKPLVDGHEAFGEIARAIKKAEHYVLITGWHIHAEFHLNRTGIGKHPDALHSLISEVTNPGRKDKPRVWIRMVLWEHEPLMQGMHMLDEARKLITAGNGLCDVTLYDRTKVRGSLHQKTVFLVLWLVTTK